MDEISDKFENWPDQIINLKVYSSLLIFLKLADKADMDKILVDSENWSGQIINLRVLSL